ncbi:Rne/Rng family ribonuclease [uncultured Thalassospira sp.]|uniref:Rne/Rng family ribonuclease n=1 Tax=uncultured Thalassospira sp. TaxID=404382 RepID=UPI0030DBB87E|tara:strand:+ start:2185 stop:5364 length:3180 start_codon:yes stop_codon:yes gene_type:complete
MVKRMLIDATHAEESRVVVINGNRLEEYDVETSTKKQIKGNIYLAKVTRVEPSLQAAFVDYGGNRHGFLAFSEIHSDYYQIPVADREAIARSHSHPPAMRDADIVEDNIGGDNDDAPKKDRKPVRSRSRRKPRKDDAASTVAGENTDTVTSSDHDDDGEVLENTAASANSETGEEDSKPRRRRMRNRRKKPEDTENNADAAAHSDDTNGNDDDNGNGNEGGSNTVATMSAEIAEISVDIDDTETVNDDENIEDMGGDDTDEFSESIRPQMQKRYKIQEVIKRRQILLVQVVKEERGNKGAALSTFLSLAGRYCVLMPNTPRGGGISRKITNAQDRKRLKSILAELEIPGGMAVIVRTAGAERTKAEIKRDFDYLMRLWDRIRETTLQSQAPCLIYEEADLIKRSIRDLYARDVDEVLVEGDEGYRIAKDFMKMLMPSHAKRVQPYKDQGVPLFHRFQVESQLDAMLNPVVQLKSGGYIVINPTEALVAIDVNSGRSTRERNIEETAYKTNLEAAEELARQLRLRDLAGLIVVDFIDMEDHRNQGAVERKLKEAMRNDRARLQIGRISPFGLLEMSRQRLRPSLVESAFEVCTHCRGVGLVRSIESSALHLLRVIEEEGMRRRAGALTVHVASEVALYILNRKRDSLAEIENRYGFTVMIFGDDSLISPDHRIERSRAPKAGDDDNSAVLNTDSVSLTAIEAPIELVEEELVENTSRDDDETDTDTDTNSDSSTGTDSDEQNKRRRRRRRRRGRPDERDENITANAEESSSNDDEDDDDNTQSADQGNGDDDGEDDASRKRRRRGKRGGRRRSRRQEFDAAPRVVSPNDDPEATEKRRSRDHAASDETDIDVIIEGDSEGQEADAFVATGDGEEIRPARERSTTAPAPARQRRDRRDRNKDNRRNNQNRDRSEVRNIPIQSGPAPESGDAETHDVAAAQTTMPAPALEPATTPAPAPEAASVPTETTAREKPVSENAQATSQPVKTEAATPAADVIKQSAPVETSPAPAAEPTTEPAAQPEPQPAEAATTTNSSDTAQEEVKAPEAPAKPKPKRKGWWSN